MKSEPKVFQALPSFACLDLDAYHQIIPYLQEADHTSNASLGADKRVIPSNHQ